MSDQEYLITQNRIHKDKLEQMKRGIKDSNQDL